MWKENSILNTYNERTRPAEIFQAFCNELGKYYGSMGMTYSKSRPKITLDNQRVRIELTFNSSRSNTPGRSVMVELGVSVTDLELDKSKPVFNNFTLFSKKLNSDIKGTIIIENVFGEQRQRVEENSESEFRYNKNFNIYGITPDGFETLIDFLNTHVFNWSIDLFETSKVKSLIDELGSWGRNFSNKEMLLLFLEKRHPKIHFE